MIIRKCETHKKSYTFWSMDEIKKLKETYEYYLNNKKEAENILKKIGLLLEQN